MEGTSTECSVSCLLTKLVAALITPCLAPNFCPHKRDPYEIEKEMMEGIVAAGEL